MKTNSYDLANPPDIVNQLPASKLFHGLKGWHWRRTPRTRQERESFSIREAARVLQRAGWQVQADAPGYKAPRIEGLRMRPDIVATQGNSMTIVEVKAGNTISEKDRVRQLSAYARSMPNVSLQVIDAAKPFLRSSTKSHKRV